MKKENAYYGMIIVLILLAANLFGKHWFPELKTLTPTELAQTIATGLVITILAGFLVFILAGFHYTDKGTYPAEKKQRAALLGIVTFLGMWTILLVANLFNVVPQALMFMAAGAVIALAAYYLPALTGTGFGVGHKHKDSVDKDLEKEHEPTPADEKDKKEKTSSWSPMTIIAIVSLGLLLLWALSSYQSTVPVIQNGKGDGTTPTTEVKKDQKKTEPETPSKSEEVTVPAKPRKSNPYLTDEEQAENAGNQEQVSGVVAKIRNGQ